MSCCDPTSASSCPCGQFVFPWAITNPPGLATVVYRVGDFTSFREAMLLPLPGETALSQTNGTTVTQIWRPGAQGDLAVQMIEWWAYLGDVLTFYNERVANQAYLGTADLPESVNRLIRLLGYRPRPGLGAIGVLAALANSVSPFTLPQVFQIQSKPGPGQQPQIFELAADTTITPPVGPPGTSAIQGTASMAPAPVPVAPPSSGNTAVVALADNSSAVKAGDRILLLQVNSEGPFPPNPVTAFALATVASAPVHTKDPQGNAYTSISLRSNDLANLASVTDVTQLHLLTSNQSAQVWPYPADTGVVMYAPAATPSALTVHLVSIVRGLRSNDPIVLEGTDSFLPWCANLLSSTEVVWYANPLSTADPSSPPTSQGSVAIAIPHTAVTFSLPASDQVTDTKANRPSYLIRYGWKDIGALITVPTATVGAAPNGAVANTTATPLALQPADGSSLTAPANTPVLVEDVNGNGAAGAVNSSGGIDLQAPLLVPPLRALFNLLPVTRGKTVANEMLGSGNALVASQDFVLQNSPVTYLSDPNSASGDNFSSTVRVWVNQLEWKEVPNFYGLPGGSQVFLTREDEQGQTHVVFGSRLPTGVNNVVASYRYGSGAQAPAAGSLTVVLKPMPGLQAIRNPVPPFGGADPDPPDQIRKLAPRSVMTFNTAVSVDDFEVIAAQAPGVVRARAAIAFDPLAQRPRVTVWVGDDPSTVGVVQSALAAAADPNRLPKVLLASAVPMTLALTIAYDPRHEPQVVQDAVHLALLDPNKGLLGVNVVQIGQVFYDSQIYAACLAVPGVTGVHALSFAVYERFHDEVLRFGGGAQPASTCCSQQHDPGQGAYLLVPDDAVHFFLTMEAAS
jgi:hypothetical protein